MGEGERGEEGIVRAGSTDRPDWNLIIRVAAGCDYRVSPINQASPVAPLIHPVIPRMRCIPVRPDAGLLRLLCIVVENARSSHRPIVRV